MARFNHTPIRTLSCRAGLFQQVCKLLFFGEKRRLSREGSFERFCCLLISAQREQRTTAQHCILIKARIQRLGFLGL